MTAYLVITDPATDPEAPLTSELAKAWRDNPIAMFEGASGAPRAVGRALMLLANYPVLTTAAADTVDASLLCNGTFSNVNSTSTSYVSAGTVTVSLATGSLRIKWSVSTTGSATADSRLLLNGSVVHTASGTGNKSYDVTVVPGDTLSLEVRRATGTGGETASISVGNSFAYANESYVTRSAYTKYTERNSS